MLKALKSHVVHAVRLVHHAIKDLRTERSPQWRKVERKFLRQNSKCAACGGKARLNVHHKRPFHLHPELELDVRNLITLCMGKDKHCHLLIGHGGTFRAYVPEVVKLAAIALRHPEGFELVAEKARKIRVYA